MSTEQDDQVLVALRNAARDLTRRRSIRDLEETLGQIVASAVETVPGVDAGSISITEHGRIETRHPTSEVIGKLDGTQSELREGPCITAIENPPRTVSSSPGISPGLTPSGGPGSRPTWSRPDIGR
ncbi:hypothetical protein [Actinomycetospora callitridis]|uniref:hypothetical protein n=1 Tax=Actinomycetospora callitridis TaxID=913944 RepID=UPI002366C302|nr:hypothetical protein [Actinomycetospora callitridis]MDD7920686.1 hypothetical protein [Actinomycetospora callitridis]